MWNVDQPIMGINAFVVPLGHSQPISIPSSSRATENYTCWLTVGPCAIFDVGVADNKSTDPLEKATR
jgi:hypothetical protein